MSFSAWPVILETRTFCSRRITAFGQTKWFRGDFKAGGGPCRRRIERSMTLEIRHTEQRFFYLGDDPAVCALSIKAILHNACSAIQ